MDGWFASGAFVGSQGVVNGLELCELCVEFCDGVGGFLAGEPLFEGAVESFDFALCLGVAGFAVDLFDVPFLECFLEEVFCGFDSSGEVRESGGVNESVVGEHGLGSAVFVGGVFELGDDVSACHALVGGDAQEVAGVVVEEVEDLDVGVICESPVGEV